MVAGLSRTDHEAWRRLSSATSLSSEARTDAAASTAGSVSPARSVSRPGSCVRPSRRAPGLAVQGGRHLGPHPLDLAQEDVGSGRTHAGELLQQPPQCGDVAVRLLAQPSEVAVPPFLQQRGLFAELGRGHLVVAPVAAPAQGLHPLLPVGVGHPARVAQPRLVQRAGGVRSVMPASSAYVCPCARTGSRTTLLSSLTASAGRGRSSSTGGVGGSVRARVRSRGPPPRSRCPRRRT